MYNKTFLIALFFLCNCLVELYAQQVIPSTGGNASGSGGSANYSVGQVVYTTNVGTNGSVVQGVQQPYEISIVSGLDETFGIKLKCLVYPNPTTDFLILKVDAWTSLNALNMSYEFYNIGGKLLENSKIEGSESFIITRNLVPSTYILKVLIGNKEVKIFKIIKY
jgi:hypothetical protein